MTLPKAVQLPRVAYTNKFDCVVLRVSVSPEDPNDFYEVTLDRHSARRLALDIMIDAERAKEWEAAEKWRKERG